MTTWASVSSTKRLAWEHNVLFYHYYWRTFLPAYDYNEIDMPLNKRSVCE